MPVDIAAWAQYLLAGIDERRELAPITAQVAELSIADAYAVQEAVLDLRLARGDSLSGAKLGLTSAAKQKQMGVNEPIYGWVLASTVAADGSVSTGELIHPRCEPEIVFVLAEDLAGPGVTAGDALDATEQIVGGIEVIDSRYEAFSFTLPDVIADNTSAARVTVGADGIGPGEADLLRLRCTFEVDGTTTGTATGAALLGDPAGCVAMLANHVGGRGRKLEAGWFVMAGALTSAQPLAAGTTATARYSSLGSVALMAQP